MKKTIEGYLKFCQDKGLNKNSARSVAVYNLFMAALGGAV